MSASLVRTSSRQLVTCRSRPQHAKLPLRPTTITTTSRRSSSTSTSHQAVVVGSGPAGITALGNLLDQGLEDVLFVDPHFNGGVFNERWRAVPSNTKVKTFIDWTKGTNTFQSIIDRTSSPNALDAMQGLDGERECPLAYPADAVLMLQDRLRTDARVQSYQGSLLAADQPQPQSFTPNAPSVWNLSLGPQGGGGGPHQTSVAAPLVVLATGASPKSLRAPEGVTPLALADVLDQAKLDSLGLDPSKHRVAVVGSSHSAVLALKFFYDRGIPTTNFYRDALKYAVYKDGWILYDNTGLKGDASRWAKEMLEHCSDANIKRVALKSDAQSEAQIYAAHLPECTHIVHAIGFEPYTVPVNGRAQAEYDPRKGQLAPGLFGAGIAFPEQVTDPVGNVEFAVGLFKFMKGARRMVPEWIQSSGALQWR